MSEVLSDELRSLGYPVISAEEKAVVSEGNMQDVMQMNFALRMANRVLLHLRSFNAPHPKQVYKKIKAIAWERFLSGNGYFSVDSFVSNQFIRDTRFANLVIKDAIVDRMQEQLGKRPDTGPDKSYAVIFVYWYGDLCEVYFDTSGETLTRHGYRENPWKAPLQENLAAGLIQASRWQVDEPFVNPMCGSGTLAIEAAMIASGIYPGHLRSNYGFMHLNTYDPEAWKRIGERNRANEALPQGRIIATDHDANAIDAARRNAQLAGVDKHIEFKVCDFSQTELPAGPGVVMINPEYGERLGDEDQLGPLYKALGDFMKTNCAGYTGYIFTGNLEAAKSIGLRTKRRIPFYNAKIDCRLLEFELYRGSRKETSG